jgi:hypothetical protein
MKRPFILSVGISDGEYQGHAYARISAEDMLLPEQDFIERYLKPAYIQAARELDARTQQPA